MVTACALELREVERRFRGVPVVHNCSLRLGAGEIVLLLGANGAGKSTLLRLCAGILRVHRGEVRRGSGRPGGVRFLGHDVMLYGELTVAENLALFSSLGGASYPCCDQVIARWELAPFLQKSINTLSRGMRAKAALANVFSRTGPLLLLDEPSSSLDDRGVEVLCSMLREERERGTATIVASHDVSRLREVISRVIVLQSGTIDYDSAAPSENAQGHPAALEEGLARYRELNR